MANGVNARVPVSLEVDRLFASFPEDALTPGRVIKHTEIAQAAGLSHKDTRYGRVATTWVKKVAAAYNIELFNEFRVGYRVLAENERLPQAVGRQMNRAENANSKALQKASRIDTSKLTKGEAVEVVHTAGHLGRAQKALIDAKNRKAITGTSAQQVRLIPGDDS